MYNKEKIIIIIIIIIIDGNYFSYNLIDLFKS